VSALYEQGLGIHCGEFPELEDQLTGWVPGDDDSPDRLDALVWAATELLLEVPTETQYVTYDDRQDITPY
jgi:phage terminase large subunit-like protein